MVPSAMVRVRTNHGLGEIAEYDGIFFTTLTHAIVSVKQVYTGGGFAGAAGSGNDNIPAAFLNLIMFSNDLLTSAELPMAAVPITAGAFTKQKITVGPFDIPAPGYVYIYVNDNSNSPSWVHFDDLKITHVHSPFVSGADYYPFGLTMSDREILTEPYRFGYQGQFSEKEEASGWNAFDFRMYDPKFGRWISRDPHKQFWSPYIGMGNNPVRGFDPDGRDVILLNAPSGAHSLGHVGMLVGNDQTGWRYLSKEGTNARFGTYGPPNELTNKILKEKPTFNSVQEFLESEYNVDSRYETGIHFNSTSEQDAAIIKQAEEGMEKKYNVMQDNCVENCTKPMEDQNVITKDYRQNINSRYPNKNYESLFRATVKPGANYGITSFANYNFSGAAFLLFHSANFTALPKAAIEVGEIINLGFIK